MIRTYGPYRGLLSNVYIFIYQMNIALLRRASRTGVSTWRFESHDDGQFTATSNRGDRKFYNSLDELMIAIAKWHEYGYQPFTHTVPVRRQTEQLSLFTNA